MLAEAFTLVLQLPPWSLARRSRPRPSRTRGNSPARFATSAGPNRSGSRRPLHSRGFPWIPAP